MISKEKNVFIKIETVFPAVITWSQKKSSPKLKRFFRRRSGDLKNRKKVFTKLQALVLTKFRCAPEKNSTFVVQITASPLQLLLPNPIAGLFLFLKQNSVSKSLKTCYFAYFSGQWGAKPPSLATLLAKFIELVS